MINMLKVWIILLLTMELSHPLTAEGKSWTVQVTGTATPQTRKIGHNPGWKFHHTFLFFKLKIYLKLSALA